jgi:adenosylmethionine-8-amino-7-oxononanoate aminotransferase
VAALIVEPVLGIGGVRLPPDGFLRQLREICDRYGMLLVFDEILTGFGRTGKMFAFEHWGVLPDVLLTSKCLTGGYVPLSAVTVREDIYETFAEDPLLGGFRHGHTNSGHAACCAGALAVLEIIQREHAVRNAELRGGQLLAGLQQTLSGVPGILEIRGKGLLVGIEFSPDVPDAADATARAARGRGVLVRHQDNIITVAPPLIVRADEIEMVIDTLGASLRDAIESV